MDGYGCTSPVSGAPSIATASRSRATPKQSRKKSALTFAPMFGVLIENCALFLSFFYFEAGADKLVNFGH
jgi:hypothetical protein